MVTMNEFPHGRSTMAAQVPEAKGAQCNGSQRVDPRPGLGGT